MELSRERSPPAAAQELPGGERYLERGFLFSYSFLFSLLGGERYLESVSFSFALFFACCLCLFCLLLLLWLLLFLLLLNLLSVCCVLEKKQLISCSFSFSVTNVVVCLKVPEARCSARRTRR